VQDADLALRRFTESAMTEHAVMMALLVFVAVQVSFVGYLAYRVHKASQQIEGITAATFLEARRVLSQYRP
jgi:hypothetical protein